MRVALFSFHEFERPNLEAAAAEFGHELHLFSEALGPRTARLASGFPVVSGFVSDRFDRETLELLAAGGTRLIALRSAGFNHVDLAAAARHRIRVVRVPAYSPNSVAEHTIGLILALNRHLPRAYNRVREGDFRLDGLLGFDLAGRTVGLAGTGRIGALVGRILLGFGCQVVAYDPQPNEECRRMGIEYVDWESLCRRSDIVSLHCPLTPESRHLIDEAALGRMKPGVMIINTSRGGLIDTSAVIEGLKSRRIGYLGLDVYEEEEALFFQDHSRDIIADDHFARLLTFPNVIVTGHQGFFTAEALHNIAHTTLQNVADFERGLSLVNEVLTPGGRAL